MITDDERDYETWTRWIDAPKSRATHLLYSAAWIAWALILGSLAVRAL